MEDICMRDNNMVIGLYMHLHATGLYMHLHATHTRKGLIFTIKYKFFTPQYIYIYILYIFPFKSKKIEQFVVNIPYIKTKRNKDIFLENK